MSAINNNSGNSADVEWLLTGSNFKSVSLLARNQVSLILSELPGNSDSEQGSVILINRDLKPEIPDWADTVDSSRITSVRIQEHGEYSLKGEEFLARAEKINSLNACVLDYYSKPENWKYIPKGFEIVLFPKTIFRNTSSQLEVICLRRKGSSWRKDHYRVDCIFDRNFGVMVSQ